VRSTLRKNMFRTLHAAKIEIVSPTFMSQRVYDAQSKVLAESNHTVSQVDNGDAKSPEEMIFDKAETAEKKSILEQRKKLLKDKIIKLEASLTDDDIDPEDVNKKITVLNQRLAYIRRMMGKMDSEMKQ
jgi:small conductance mechanosensitive channel